MLRTTAVLLLVAFCLSVCGCDERNENLSLPSQVSQTVSETERLTLEDVVCSEEFTLYGVHTEVSVYYHTSDNQYDGMNFYFDNRNESFFLAFVKFLSTELEPYSGEYNYSADEIYVRFDDNSFSVTAENFVQIYVGIQLKMYYCQGIYKKTQEFLKPFFDHNYDYYETAYTRVLRNYEFKIKDINGDVIDSGAIFKEPHIFVSNSTVHMRVQWGTGILSCTSTYYDVFTGQKSPEYSGYTDYYRNLVCTAYVDRACIYEMFSGKLLAVFDQFKLPVAEYMAEGHVQSAYFSTDGKQILVYYFAEINGEAELVTQSFDLPQKVIDKQ